MPDGAVSARKREHLEHALGDSQSGRSPGWDDVDLVHCSLPELDLDRIELGVTLLDRWLGAPLVVAAMTGGHADATEINVRLARAAQHFGLAMGVGSQRAALLDPALAPTYAVVREQAPDAFLIANVGAAQLIPQAGSRRLDLDDVRAAVEMIAADALAVHLNFLEEVVQPEGEARAAGCLAAIGELAAGLDVPVIAKETGGGIAPRLVPRLLEAGVAALDVGGRGGTSFAIIEGRRAAGRGDTVGARLGELFADWGLPTAVSVAAAAGAPVPVIATGGIRSGLDAAKALALGATAVGVARPLLAAAVAGDAALEEVVGSLLHELRVALFLCGAASPGALRTVPRVVHGETLRWLSQLGLVDAPPESGR